MIRPVARAAGSYEPVDAADYDDQNDDTHFRGRKPSAYQHLSGENEEEYDHVSYSQRSSSWANVDEVSQHDASEPQHANNPLMRSVSREGSVLSHPIPDLQSIQGAYAGNVSRLEESAERLSLNSDIGEELRKLNLEQKRAGSRRSSVIGARQFSSSSHTNSIIGLNSVARSGGFSHEGYVTSPLSSIRSPAWSQMDHASQQDAIAREPLQEGKPLDSPISIRSNVLTVRNQDQNDSLVEAIEEHGQYSEYVEHGVGQEQEGTGLDVSNVQRNASTATKDTYRQAEDAFADFDGVHIPSEVASPIYEENQPEVHPELQQEIEAAFEGHTEDPIDRSFSPTFSESLQTYTRNPEPGENGMVFYPAPVPMMLNLPQKLSKNVSTAKMAQRRSQFMLPRRKSMASLSGLLEGEEGEDQGKGAIQEKPLPPQLRATMYFDQPSNSPDIEVKDRSAVATLESILDASAHAPVSAFTDHPLSGHVGPEIYGKPIETRKPPPRISQSSTDLSTPALPVKESTRRSFLGFGKKSKTQSTQLTSVDLVKETDAAGIEGEDSPLRISQDEELQQRIQAEDEQLAEQVRTDRPTTLLAELQIRKVEQSKRNRTAVTAFPDGMHSTLLQLDAVAQMQRQTRKQKQVTLAWEDPAAANEPEPDETEDVPLGVLFPTSKLKPNDPTGRFEEDRPLGLLAKRQMEENEPLSARRARLRGDPPPVPSEVRRSMLRSPGPPSPNMPEEEKKENGEEAGETLAQRKLRLAVKDAIPTTRPVSGDFTSELLSQFGPLEEKAAPPTTSQTPDPDETLGQRKKRLQAEAAAQRQVSGESGASGGDEPAINVAQKRRSMADLLANHPVGQPAVSGSAQARGLLGNVEAHRRSLISPTSNKRKSTSRQSSYNMNTNVKMNLAPGFYMPGQMPYGQNMGLAGQQQTQGNAGTYVNPMTYTPMMGLNGGMHAMPAYQQMGGIAPVDHTPLNTKQRDMIDRWRQSVL